MRTVTIMLTSLFCTLFAIGLMGFLFARGGDLTPEEKYWKEYIQQHHCVFVEVTQEAGLPLSTWRCDTGMHHVNIATHATDNGISVGKRDSNSREIIKLMTFACGYFLFGLIIITVRVKLESYLYKIREGDL